MRELTFNQARVLDRIREQVQKGTKVSVTAAMRGIYSPSTATRPEKITKLPAFQELLNEYLPDDLVTRRHRELLDKRDIEIVYDEIKKGKGWIRVPRVIDKGPETQAVSKAIEMKYRLGNRYPNPANSMGVQFNFGTDNERCKA